MTSRVSVPEKTIEHWSSQYLSYRYNSNVGLWWPARGEDLDISWLPGRPGKAVQIEFKTTTVRDSDPNIHVVKVDLGQLQDYRRWPPGQQPFYAFPRPSWPGTLKSAMAGPGRSATELGTSRRGGSWWFAHWMVCLTAEQVAGVVADQIPRHGGSARGKRADLVRWDVRRPAAAVWGGGGVPDPEPVPWRQFWSELNRCGRAGWPQLIRVPALARPPRRYSRSDVVELLRSGPASADIVASGEAQALVTLQPDREGAYVVADPVTDSRQVEVATMNRRPRPPDEADVDYRQVVFLDATALDLATPWT